MTNSSRMMKKLLERFNFFANSIKSLNIAENIASLNRTDDLTNPVGISKKAGKQLKQVEEVIVEPLMQIWNKEIIKQKIPFWIKMSWYNPNFQKTGLCLKRKL